MTTVILSKAEALGIARQALLAVGALPEIADIVAQSHIAADGDGLASHGLARLPGCCLQVRSGRIKALALPQLS